MSACRWISASGERKCRLTADIGRGKPPYRAVRTECVCAIRRGRRSPSLNCDADASSGRNARVDRRTLKRCRTPAFSQSSRADSLPNGGSLRTRRGFFTDETNVRQSAGMERECDPAVSPLERRGRGKGNPCGAERKRSASMFSRSPRPIIPLRPVKGAISGGRQGNGRPYPWRGKLIFAFARRSLLSVREALRVAPEPRPRCAGTVMPLRRNGDLVLLERPSDAERMRLSRPVPCLWSPRSPPPACMRGVNVSPADPLDGCAASRTDGIPVPMRKNSHAHEKEFSCP